MQRLIGECRVGDHGPVERQHRGHPGDVELGQRAGRPLQGLSAAGAGHDQLADQRVEHSRDRHSGRVPGVEPHPWASWRVPGGDRARGRKEVPAGVFGVDPEFDRVPPGRRVVVTEMFPLGDAEHLAHQVDPCHFLADRVLDLQSGVDLEEADRAVLGDEELAGARAHVAGQPQDVLGGGVERLGLRRGQERGRGLLDELLVPALQGAVPGRDHHHIAVRVGQALRFHVPRPVQVPLDEALAPAERRGGLPDRRLVQLGDLVLAPGHLEAAAAAAERGLDRHREAMLGGERQDLVGPGDRVLRARRQRGPGRAGDVPGPDLVAERLDGLRRRADPGQARVDHRAGEVGVLGQEAVAGMHRVRAGLGRHLDDLPDVQVGLLAGHTAQRIGFVGHPHMQRVQVGLGVDGHAGQPGVTARPDDPHGDLAAVGDQYLAHVFSSVQDYGESLELLGRGAIMPQEL